MDQCPVAIKYNCISFSGAAESQNLVALKPKLSASESTRRRMCEEMNGVKLTVLGFVSS